MKVAMVRAHEALGELDPDARLVLQIHDELLIEAPAGRAAAAGRAVRDAMAGAFDLEPALVVDVGEGHTWLEAK
jgi:DNA polymerase-1